MEGTNKVTFEKVLPGILAFFSIAFSVVLPSWAAIIAGSTWVGLLLFAGIVICLIYHQTEWGKTLPYVLVPLWLISCISCGRTYMENRKVHAREPLADATESLVESIVRSHNSPHWVIETLDGGNLVCFLVDADYLQRHERFVWDASDPAKYAALLGDSTETGWKFRVELIKVEYKDIQASSKSVVGYADRRILKDGWDREGVELLPESTLLTIRGARHMETFNWEKSRSLFEESSRLENPAGTYYLAKWYGTGCGTEAAPDEYRRKLEEAARNGSRLARYEWANGVLSYGSASPVEKAKAVDFLKSAYSLKTVATLTTVLTSQRSVQLLSRYYQKTGQGIRAFLATRSYLKAFDNPHIRYHDHLVNTLTLGLSRRALKAVREGETLGIPNCYYIHGIMYAQGIGEKENRREAEKYLRYAGDELHYREAYLGLAMLSDKRKAKRASDFWRMMYDVNFSDTIAE